ncbi:uncharacterized protein LOC126674326 [Mercurialis annua]|uniref:uncharacterized protein LOC126674326 n=1 Tax=Mercurialis annua TaxID=3986 RepID=UPI00215F2391|nr:uncharacterized protein LOC126674326 [Mercurialis annua]
MSQESFLSDATTTTATTSTSAHKPSQSSITDYSHKIQSALQSLSPIITLSPSILSSQDPPFSLLHHPHVSSQISTLLRHPDSGAGDNHLCRWFYDTFQSGSPQLQLVVLRFLPIIAGLYLSRIPLRKPLAGFEAVLLALYAHETTSRNGQAITVNIPDLSNSSVYHETKEISKNNSTDFNLAVISPSLEPHGTVRSTRRARIVGVTLELYFSKISAMPVDSKVDFCEFCKLWCGEMYKEFDGKEKADEEGRIPLPWELLQPILRILSHCLLGAHRKEKNLVESAGKACASLYGRCLRDIDAKAILATGSLLRLSKMDHVNPNIENEIDCTEVTITSVISL